MCIRDRVTNLVCYIFQSLEWYAAFIILLSCRTSNNKIPVESLKNNLNYLSSWQARLVLTVHISLIVKSLLCVLFLFRKEKAIPINCCLILKQILQLDHITPENKKFLDLHNLLRPYCSHLANDLVCMKIVIWTRSTVGLLTTGCL